MTKKTEYELSPSGNPMIRHSEADAVSGPPEQDAVWLEQVSAHIEKHVGPIEMVYHEIVSDVVHVDVLHVAPSPTRPFHLLASAGMSDKPMTVPPESGAPTQMELVVLLPADWPINMKAFDDEANYWPLRNLKMLARFPHRYRTWLSFGHTIPNGDPPAPFANGTELSSIILLPSMTIDSKFIRLDLGNGKDISLLALYPLHQDELELKINSGTDALLDLFEKESVSDIIDPGRRSVCRPRKSWWWPFS